MMTVTPVAVIQPKPGIGDVIWHLPFIRAIAAASPGKKVTFLAPPTSGARELLAAEPSVAETLYFEHSGSELQRAINLIRLVALLRRCRFHKLWILDLTNGTILLIGGTAHSARAQNLIAGTGGADTINACDLKLIEAAALLHHADLFIGNDSGPLNLAAATGTDAFGLFGTTRVLKYSKFIHPIVPDGGLAPDGLQRISPAQVLEQVRPYLSLRKARG
jgi:ADP-heptose:LPS heptosyltransferase